MPHSTASPLLHIITRNLTDSHSQCLMALSVHSGVGKWWNAANFSIPLNLSVLPSPIARNNCSSLKDQSVGICVVGKRAVGAIGHYQ